MSKIIGTEEEIGSYGVPKGQMGIRGKESKN